MVASLHLVLPREGSKSLSLTCVLSSSLLQLKKLIGKLKTDKFGSRIIDLIQQFTCSEASESRDKFFAQDENEEHQEHTDVKRQKKNETLVDIESGEDDDE